MTESAIPFGTDRNWKATTGTRCLFVCTSKYNASSLRLVADELSDWDCWFSLFYRKPTLSVRLARKFVPLALLSSNIENNLVQGMEQLGLRMDVDAKNHYDIVVLGTDIFVPHDLRSQKPIVLVQEGWVWTKSWRRWLCERTPLPPWFAVGNGIGLSRNYDYFCVASQGYKNFFVQSGIASQRLMVTGLPFLDAIKRDLTPLIDHTHDSNFVLVVTHPGREYGEGDNRKQLIMKARTVARGRPIIVKLHPYENRARATREISAWLPDAQVVVDANINHLIANCTTFVTTYSTTIFIALLLGKEIYCSYPIDEILKLMPEQNSQAAHKIAEVCRTALLQTHEGMERG